MVNCIKSGREVKEGQKRYVTNIRGSEKVAGTKAHGTAQHPRLPSLLNPAQVDSGTQWGLCLVSGVGRQVENDWL
ncbi:hypothetical protein ACOMHN_012695 [Nucella lapillus]